jgi:SPX domain protein involved in polyphosphate accumulation
MKFEEIFEDYTILEWKAYYLNYGDLKKKFLRLRIRNWTLSIQSYRLKRKKSLNSI